MKQNDLQQGRPSSDLELERKAAAMAARSLSCVVHTGNQGLVECIFRASVAVVVLCLLPTAVPNTKLCAWGEEDSGGHVL
jgi:hypothetical protein